jgi:hypothetical protein
MILYTRRHIFVSQKSIMRQFVKKGQKNKIILL